MTSTTFTTAPTAPRANGAAAPWAHILRLPRAWAELRAFRRMDAKAMADAGLTAADLEQATLTSFLCQPGR